jgi:hypothetical protein
VSHAALNICNLEMCNYRISLSAPSANALILRVQGSLQLEGVVREGLAYVARDAHAYADEISEHSALEVRSGVACVSFYCVWGFIHC